MRALLIKGADPFIKDVNNMTPMDIANRDQPEDVADAINKILVGTQTNKTALKSGKALHKKKEKGFSEQIQFILFYLCFILIKFAVVYPRLVSPQYSLKEDSKSDDDTKNKNLEQTELYVD